ncbi:MAG: hypothetical protein ACYCZN_03535 [Candidatus Dormibacteria bacterium]
MRVSQADTGLIRVPEARESKDHNDAALLLAKVKQPPARQRPMPAGDLTSPELAVVGGL